MAPFNSTYFTSKNTNFSRVPELTSLKLSWITITITTLKMFQYKFLSLEILFKGVILVSNWCSISNNIKAPVKMRSSVKNEAINYLSPMKASRSISEKDWARIVNILLNIKLQVMAIQFASLLERNFALFSGNFQSNWSSKFLLLGKHTCNFLSTYNWGLCFH